MLNDLVNVAFLFAMGGYIIVLQKSYLRKYFYDYFKCISVFHHHRYGSLQQHIQRHTTW